MNADSLRERSRPAHHAGRAPRSSHRVRTHLSTMLAFAFVAFAGCGAGITDALSGTAGMYVQTEDELASSGLAGGPFLPASIDYDISNVGTIPMTWSVSSDQPWVDVTPSNGVLDSLQSESVAVTFAPAAAQLLPGSYTANVSFVNQTDSVGNTSRRVTLTVTAPGSQAMTTATRTTGVAPLSVVFDAVGSQSGVVQPAGPDPDFAAFAYEWDYGNPNAGLWQHTGKPKNKSVGWIGYHIFETPGNYRVSLQVTDAQGATHSYHQDVTVTDPNSYFSSATFYVAQNGSDSNPGTQSQPFATIERGIQALGTGGMAGRVLARRGDTFLIADSLQIGATQNIQMLGAYGTGNKPVLNFTGANVGIRLAGSNARICDIDLQCTSTTRVIWARGLHLGQLALAFRCTVNGFGQGIGVSSVHQATAYECSVTNSSEYGLYSSGNNDTEALHMLVLGCQFVSAGQHLLRSYISRSSISHNLVGSTPGFTAMKLAGKPYPNPHQHVMLCDNTVTTETSGIIAIGPQNQQSITEITEHFLIEGNRFHSRVSGDFCLGVSGPKITIRNNIFDIGDRHAIKIGPAWGVGPTPYRCRVDHNTAYRGSGAPLRFLETQSSDSTQVRNNILICPAGGVSITGTNFVANNQQTDPGFRNAIIGDFSFPTTSPATNSTPWIGVRTDFMLSSRPANGLSTPGAILPF